MLTAEELVALKAKVKAEMARRSGNGSIAHLSGAEWDFENKPMKDGLILAEHGKKVIEPLLHVADHGDLKFVQQGEGIPDSFSKELNSWVDSLANEPTEGSQSSCRSQCTGLCAGTCSTACSGCNGCSGCKDSCTGQCDAKCVGCTGCGSGCNNGCKGCSGTCGSGCASGCNTSAGS